jgi:fumarate reductase (CoM/CoB) subunit A
METITTDVLIIGAGAAGIRAAVSACEAEAEVIVIGRGPLAESGSTFSTLSSGWGLQALVGTERTPKALEDFYDDIMRVGLGCCNAKLARILVEESGARFEDLQFYGIRFKKDDQGRHMRVAGCFSDTPRAFVTESLANVKHSMVSIFCRPPANSIRFITGFALSLIASDKVCGGAWVWEDSGHTIKICAKATVLSTGGGAGLFEHHMVSDFEIGQGYALAHEAGADLANLEFIQFMPGYRKGPRPCFLPIDALEQPGRLVDQKGRDLLTKHIPDAAERAKAVATRKTHFPFSCRDESCLVDLAITIENAQDGQAFWTDSASIEDLYEVVHFSHAFNGGICIGDGAQTTVGGLFAAGEVAAGPHGADRIGGCMMTATQVFGERAGRYAALHAKRKNVRADDGTEKRFTTRLHTKKRGSGDEAASKLTSAVQNIFSRQVGILRNAMGLRACLDAIKRAEADLVQIADISLPVFYRTHQTLLTMRLITKAALKRKESRGAHFRQDFPPGNYRTIIAPASAN